MPSILQFSSVRNGIGFEIELNSQASNGGQKRSILLNVSRDVTSNVARDQVILSAGNYNKLLSLP